MHWLAPYPQLAERQDARWPELPRVVWALDAGAALVKDPLAALVLAGLPRKASDRAYALRAALDAGAILFPHQITDADELFSAAPVVMMGARTGLCYVTAESLINLVSRQVRAGRVDGKCVARHLLRLALRCGFSERPWILANIIETFRVEFILGDRSSELAEMQRIGERILGTDFPELLPSLKPPTDSAANPRTVDSQSEIYTGDQKDWFMTRVSFKATKPLREAFGPQADAASAMLQKNPREPGKLTDVSFKIEQAQAAITTRRVTQGVRTSVSPVTATVPKVTGVIGDSSQFRSPAQPRH